MKNHFEDHINSINSKQGDIPKWIRNAIRNRKHRIKYAMNKYGLSRKEAEKREEKVILIKKHKRKYL